MDPNAAVKLAIDISRDKKDSSPEVSGPTSSADYISYIFRK